MINIRKYGKQPFNTAVIHGGPGAPGSVAAVARELSRDFGILEPIQTATTLEGQVSELKTVLEDNGNAPFALIGHSWGAWLAYIFTARYPSLVEKLILVGSGPFEKEYVKQLAENRLNRLTLDEQSEFKSLLKELNSPETEDKDKKLSRLGKLANKADSYDPIIIDTEENDRIPVEGSTYLSVWAEAAKLRENGMLLEMGKQIDCPVIAIHGDYDPHPFEGVEKPLATVLKELRVLLLKQCGHTPWKEQHAKDEFYRAIRTELLGQS